METQNGKTDTSTNTSVRFESRSRRANPQSGRSDQRRLLKHNALHTLRELPELHRLRRLNWLLELRQLRQLHRPGMAGQYPSTRRPRGRTVD